MAESSLFVSLVRSVRPSTGSLLLFLSSEAEVQPLLPLLGVRQHRAALCAQLHCWDDRRQGLLVGPKQHVPVHRKKDLFIDSGGESRGPSDVPFLEVAGSEQVTVG